MKHLLILVLLTGLASDDVCRKRRWRCELRCVEDTPGGSMERLRCYERCRDDYLNCRSE